MMVPLIAALALIRQNPVPQAETWNLKPTFDTKALKQVWASFIDAEADGENHHATFNFTRITKSVKPTKIVDTFRWEKLNIDEQEGQDLEAWDVSVGPRGQLLKMNSESDDTYRRMLSPMVFVYPEKPVAIGDKWTVEVTPVGKAPKVTYAYEAKSKEIVDGINTIVVALDYKEDAKDGVNGTGYWWLSKVGKVVKFELLLDNWLVPMTGPDPVNVAIHGKAQ